MDECTDALDCCNTAAKLSFEKDTELEAKCEAFAGKIYYKGLVNIKKAKHHLTNAIKLSLTLLPKDVSNEPWHQLAVKHLQEVRERLLKEEQERTAAENKPYLDALKEDFEKLEAEVKKGCKEFLTYINDNYVPAEKKIDLKEEMTKESQLKKTMIKSFVPIFHPDKNVNEEKKIQLLREEICKHINNFVEQFKGKVD